jgi:hypothetical protein
MKNIIYFDKNVTCYCCKKKDFFCYTPNGADYTTCPLCDGIDQNYNYSSNSVYDNYDLTDEDNQCNLYSFCDRCKLVYDVGCIHATVGCTDNCYNAHFIGKYKYKDNIYIGSPQFDDIDEWYNSFRYENEFHI